MLASFLLGREDILPMNVFTLMAPALVLIILLALLPGDRLDARGAVFAYIAANVASALAFAAFSSANVKLKFAINAELLKEMFRYGIKFYPNGILFYLVIQSDLLLVNYFRGSRSFPPDRRSDRNRHSYPDITRFR